MSEDLDVLISEHPQASAMLSRHWLAVIIGIAGLVVSTIVVQSQVLAFAPIAAGEQAMLGIVLVILHALACLGGMLWQFSAMPELRRQVSSDAQRLQQVVHYLRIRQRWVLGLALAGQVVVVAASIQGISFADSLWLVLPLVPSFLLLSLGFRQPPTGDRLAIHVRRLRYVQQSQSSLT
ncbi:MAG: hypothetical protein EA401_07440 [Planctomycetota bacterium]|nr:MAG: hypothetical protein EA401_07440 [Planctomycetota bacterium]